MFKRIRNIWKLGEYRIDEKESVLATVGEEVILSKPKPTLVRDEPLGDGNASFLGEGTHEEFEDQKKEDEGMKPWYKRLKDL